MNFNQAYLRSQFIIGPLSWFVNPFVIVRIFLFKKLRKHAAVIHGQLLDFGCGRKPYKSLFNVQEYIGIDVEQSGHSHQGEDVDVFFDGVNIPFSHESFDGVLMTEVLEHVFEPDKVLAEIHRVLKPEGKFLLTVPFVWPEHEVPYDYARYTPYALKHLLAKHGFEIKEIESGPPATSTFVQLFTAVVYSVLPRNKWVKLAGTMVLIAPVNLLGYLLGSIIPVKSGFYFNTVVLAEKKS